MLAKTVAVVETTSPAIAPKALVPRCAMDEIEWLRRMAPLIFSKLPRNIHDCIVTIAEYPWSWARLKPRMMKLVHRSLYASGYSFFTHAPIHFPRLELPMYGGLATTTSYRAVRGSNSDCRRFNLSLAASANRESASARDARALAGLRTPI